MVHFAPLHQSGVVIGSGGIDYGGVHFVVGCKFEPLGNNCFDVVAAVRLVEMVVSGDNLCGNIFFQIRDVSFHFLYKNSQFFSLVYMFLHNF